MPQLPCSVKTKTLLSRGINIRQIWPAKASASVSLTECWLTALLSNTPATGGRFRRNKHASVLLQIPRSRQSVTRQCLKAHWLQPDRHVHLLAGKASRKRRHRSAARVTKTALYTTQRRSDGCTTARRKNTKKRLGVHRTTFRHRGWGHDLLRTLSNRQDNSFLVPAHGTASANGVGEHLTYMYTSTTANDKAGRPPSYRH